MYLKVPETVRTIPAPICRAFGIRTRHTAAAALKAILYDEGGWAALWEHARIEAWVYFQKDASLTQ
jgi:hypothetical protein